MKFKRRICNYVKKIMHHQAQKANTYPEDINTKSVLIGV